MSVNLTNYDAAGWRWSPDRTIRVEPQFESPGMWVDQRNKPLGYEVLDTFTHQATRVRTIQQARTAAAELLAARPALNWGLWCGERSPRQGRTKFMLCAADSPVGRVDLRLALREDREHHGMWYVSFNIGMRNYGWLSDIRWIPHRMLHLQAHATQTAYNLGPLS